MRAHTWLAILMSMRFLDIFACILLYMYASSFPHHPFYGLLYFPLHSLSSEAQSDTFRVRPAQEGVHVLCHPQKTLLAGLQLHMSHLNYTLETESKYIAQIKPSNCLQCMSGSQARVNCPCNH